MKLFARTMVGAFALVAIACSNVDAEAVNTVECPPLGDESGTDPVGAFRPVSGLLEQRCGTLDCHGDPGRPLLIYSRIGLRADDDAFEDDPQYFSGGQTPTTDFEIEQNYRSTCGLEPEKIAEVFGGSLDADELTLVRKPKLRERHKGGIIWEDGKAGDRCLKLWASGAEEATYAATCRDALEE